MILDTRQMTHPAYRPLSVAGAVACVLDTLEIGDSVLVEQVICSNGKPAAETVVRSTISKLSNGRHFITRREADGRRVYRIG